MKQGCGDNPTDEEAALELHRPAKRSWLSAQVLGFGIASFLSDAGHEAATSALPALIATLGAAPAALGIIEGLSDGAASVAKLAGGWWADRPRTRKPLAVAGYVVTGASVGIFAIATSWAHVLIARTIGWLARGARGPARDAMLSDAVPKEALGRAFGLHRAMDTAGAIVGPLLAIVLTAVVPLRTSFLWFAVPGVLAGVAYAVLVRAQRDGAHHKRLPLVTSLRGLPAGFRRLLLAVFLFGLGDFARSLLILRATQLLSPELGFARAAATAMGLYVLHNVVYAAASYPVGRLADKLSPVGLLAVGYGVGAATAVLAALATSSMWMLVPLFLAAGLTLAFEDTLEGTLTALLTPPHLRGTAYGAMATTNGVGDLLSSSLVGLAWTVFGPAVAFLGAAILCGMGTVGVLLTPRGPAEELE